MTTSKTRGLDLQGNDLAQMVGLAIDLAFKGHMHFNVPLATQKKPLRYHQRTVWHPMPNFEIKDPNDALSWMAIMGDIIEPLKLFWLFDVADRAKLAKPPGELLRTVSLGDRETMLEGTLSRTTYHTSKGDGLDLGSRVNFGLSIWGGKFAVEMCFAKGGQGS